LVKQRLDYHKHTLRSETSKFRRLDESFSRRNKTYRQEKIAKEKHLKETCFKKIPKQEETKQ
jgi:hypothetical protein